MAVLILPISALLAGVALLLLGSGLLNTLLALRGELEGYSGPTFGLIMSGYFIGFFVGTYLALPLVQRVGHIRSFAFCAALIASLVLLHVLFINPYVWFLVRVLNGAALVILYTVIESWLNGQTPADKRGRVFAIYMTVNLGALALAQQLLRLDPTLSFTLFALASILISLSLLPVTWTRFPQPEVHRVERVKLSLLNRVAPVAMWAAFLSGIAMGAFWGLGALFASRIGLDTNGVASFISCTIVGGALLQFPIGRLSDGMDRRRMLGIISLTAGATALLLLPVTETKAALLGLIAIYGGLAFAVYPVAIAHLVDHLEPEHMLAGGSSLLLLHGVGAVIGPAMAGELLAQFGPSSLPLFWAIVHLILGVFALVYQHRGDVEDPAEHHADFVPMVRTTPTAFELLPPEEQVEDPHHHSSHQVDSELHVEHASVWGHTDEVNQASEEKN